MDNPGPAHIAGHDIRYPDRGRRPERLTLALALAAGRADVTLIDALAAPVAA
jgi:hypothetical protein